MRVSSRLQTKHKLMVLNNHMCEWCEMNPASDMHEIVSRSMTRKGSEARERSYDERICCVLCRECHSKAHGKKAREALLAIKVLRYGMDDVREAMQEVAEAQIRSLLAQDDLDDGNA